MDCTLTVEAETNKSVSRLVKCILSLPLCIESNAFMPFVRVLEASRLGAILPCATENVLEAVLHLVTCEMVALRASVLVHLGFTQVQANSLHVRPSLSLAFSLVRHISTSSNQPAAHLTCQVYLTSPWTAWLVVETAPLPAHRLPFYQPQRCGSLATQLPPPIQSTRYTYRRHLLHDQNAVNTRFHLKRALSVKSSFGFGEQRKIAQRVIGIGPSNDFSARVGQPAPSHLVYGAQSAVATSLTTSA
jgi:hypothetical protein